MKSITIYWDGPFGWPKFENDLPPIPERHGVYLMTIKHKDGYLIQGPGITSRSIYERFCRHKREYLNGVYNVLDIDAMRKGVRKEVWHGFWMGKERAQEKQEEFNRRRLEITIAVCRLFAGYRIFTTDVGDKRVRERLEAAIVDNLDRQENPFRNIPDKGMHLMRKRQSEDPITVNNKCSAILLGLPSTYTI